MFHAIRKPQIIALDAATVRLAADKINCIEYEGDDKQRAYVAYGMLTGMQAREGDPLAKDAARTAFAFLLQQYQEAFAAGFAIAHAPEAP